MAYRPQSFQERVLHRLKITQGHLKKVSQMIEDDAYCIDIIHQSHAIQKALKEIDQMLLENHLKHCVSDSIMRGESEQAIKEVMEVFKKNNL